ncbi:hypothetical protein ACIBF1_10005 [Spirillospora sp. NPDC050679]
MTSSAPRRRRSFWEIFREQWRESGKDPGVRAYWFIPLVFVFAGLFLRPVLPPAAYFGVLLVLAVVTGGIAAWRRRRGRTE